MIFFFFSSRRRHTRFKCDWSSDVCSSDLFTSTMAARAARRHGVPYVLRPLGTLDAWGMAQRRPGLKSLSMRWIEGPMLREAAAVHFTSEEEAVQARRLGLPLRGAIIPLGVLSRVPAHTARAARPAGHCL